MKLTSENVRKLFKKCLYGKEVSKDNLPKNCVVVEGVVNNFAFNKGILEEEKGNILDMLHQLPHQFMKDT